MIRRPLLFGTLLVLAVVALYVFLPSRDRTPSGLSTPSPLPSPAPAERAPIPSAAAGPLPATLPSPPFDPADFPLAAALNAADSTIARDLDILQQLFDAWRTNFPREGNPIGENAEIAAALAGANPLGLTLVPKAHPAFNARGELCDRWGTPFRFHQLSGEHMEVRSAGPDRKFATDDDAVWTPQ
jgi:hypothetical protein